MTDSKATPQSQKQDLRERCYYLLTLFKAKDMALFEKYTAQLAKTSAEESTDFYYFLLGEYKKLVEGPSFTQRPLSPYQEPTTASAPNANPAKKVAKKIAKKASAKTASKKKTVKSPTKKTAKKVTKKITKKTSKKTKKRN